MFRSARADKKYEKLGKEASGNEDWVKEELKRSTSLASAGSILQRNPTKKKEKSHPIFRFMDLVGGKKKKATPEMARYAEYVKEAGMWDLDSNKPVIHYK